MRDVYLLASLFPVLANARSHWTENMVAVILLEGCPSVKSTAAVLSKHIHVETMKSNNRPARTVRAGGGKQHWHTVSVTHMWQNSINTMNLRSCKLQVLLFTHWKWIQKARELSTGGRINLSLVQQSCILWKLKSAYMQKKGCINGLTGLLSICKWELTITQMNCISTGNSLIIYLKEKINIQIYLFPFKND